MTLQFLGAARTVTGSMHLVHVNGNRILLDCGLFQGRREEANQRNRNFPFDPKSIDAIILSHAHIDHSGNLPGIVRQGFRGPIYCTPATRDLCEVMLADSAHIQEKDVEFVNKKREKHGEPTVEPLYVARDATAAMELFRTVPYDRAFDVVKGLAAKFVDAGHILGSASVTATYSANGSRTTLGFTGDLGRKSMPIIRDPVFMGNVDALISESTYGGKKHDAAAEMDEQLARAISQAIQRGGKIIVPAFSVGRTQEIVYSLHKLRDSGKLPDIPVFVDSPLAVNATDIFKRHVECFDDDIGGHIARHHDPLGLGQLHYVRTPEESKKLNTLREPCMIIAASGMCEAGRVLHHLANNIEDPKCTILIVGYQAEHTLGKKLVDRWEEVKIFGEVYKRKAEVVVLNSFSAHADGQELVDYIDNFDKRQLQKVFLVHGELERPQALKSDLERESITKVEIPERGQEFDL